MTLLPTASTLESVTHRADSSNRGHPHGLTGELRRDITHTIYGLFFNTGTTSEGRQAKLTHSEQPQDTSLEFSGTSTLCIRCTISKRQCVNTDALFDDLQATHRRPKGHSRSRQGARPHSNGQHGPRGCSEGQQSALVPSEGSQSTHVSSEGQQSACLPEGQRSARVPSEDSQPPTSRFTGKLICQPSK